MGADQGLTRLFYDGDCGFCLGAVRFTAQRDRSDLIRFAPLGGETFLRLVPPEQRTGLPDSLVVLTQGGDLLIRSDAVIHLLGRMGPGWRAVGLLLRGMPRPLRDAGYRLVARLRPARQTCPRDGARPDDRFEP